MAFQGLLYAASYDHLSVPLLSRDNISMASLNPGLLEEVKNVLIPADMLRIEDSQVIGKGKSIYLACFSNCSVQTNFITTTFLFLAGHFGTVYHGYLRDSNKQEMHCAVKSLNSMQIRFFPKIFKSDFEMLTVGCLYKGLIFNRNHRFKRGGPVSQRGSYYERLRPP